MLVLTRKHDEQIVIGEEGNQITITILKIQGSEKVSIGIEAHPNTPIFRKELLARGGGDRKKRREDPRKPTAKDINRLIEAVEMASEHREKDEEEKPAQEYNCYLH